MDPPIVQQPAPPRADSAQSALPLVTAGVQRYVWESRFGAMLIEVIDGAAFVNGERVVMAAGVDAATPSPPQPGVRR